MDLNSTTGKTEWQVNRGGELQPSASARCGRATITSGSASATGISRAVIGAASRAPCRVYRASRNCARWSEQMNDAASTAAVGEIGAPSTLPLPPLALIVPVTDIEPAPAITTVPPPALDPARNSDSSSSGDKAMPPDAPYGCAATQPCPLLAATVLLPTVSVPAIVIVPVARIMVPLGTVSVIPVATVKFEHCTAAVGRLEIQFALALILQTPIGVPSEPSPKIDAEPVAPVAPEVSVIRSCAGWLVEVLSLLSKVTFSELAGVMIKPLFEAGVVIRLWTAAVAST